MPVEGVRPARRHTCLPDFRKGELGRLALEHLGGSDAPVTARTIVDGIVARKAIAPSAPEREQIQKNVTKTLWRNRERGLSRSPAATATSRRSGDRPTTAQCEDDGPAADTNHATAGRRLCRMRDAPLRAASTISPNGEHRLTHPGSCHQAC